ncbi:MAG TPA: hypothetical protein DE117_00875 [Fervidobacterium sp.]|nr:hypothetical protein [Fervidobacterium sp.]
MKKVFTITLLLLVVVSSFALKTVQQPILSYLSPFVVEKTSYEANGIVEKVVLGVYGRGYAVISYDDNEVQVPLIWSRYPDVKAGTEVYFKGIKATALVPISLETNGYKIILRPIGNVENSGVHVLETKVKSIEISRNAITVVLTDSQGKEYKIPGALMPIWKTLKVGDDVKINVIKTNVNTVQSITIDGKTYSLGNAMKKEESGKDVYRRKE